MKCPKCGTQNLEDAKKCARCGVLFYKRASRPAKEAEPEQPAEPKPRTPARRALRVLFWVVCVVILAAVLGYGLYKFVFWREIWVLERKYEMGELMPPTVEIVELDDGRTAHAVTFYGDDGDAIFIEEMCRSYVITGNFVRIEIPDSHWFDLNPSEVEAVNITFTPILITAKNEKKPLPDLEFTVETPKSPLKLINPKEPLLTVNTSLFPLSVQVVPGSTVTVGGKDVSDVVDLDGLLTANINVYAQGDNVVSILVKTPYHQETRQDITLYRAPQEINLEYNVNTATKSSRETMEITGNIEPGAMLKVDTTHVENSIQLDYEKGTYSFEAKFETIGDNTVTFRAMKEGKADSVISLSVYYVPPLSQYSRKAWAMAYDDLKRMGDLWQGRIFLCEGTIIDVIPGETQIVMMDVGTGGERQLVALNNLSSVGTPDIGRVYRAYADVSGQYFYNSEYYPYLQCRYMEQGKTNN